jgi:hypothetical protein
LPGGSRGLGDVYKRQFQVLEVGENCRFWKLLF